MKKHQRQCMHCKNGIMSLRGAGNVSGGSYWKCKNKKCGRTHWKHPVPLPPAEIRIDIIKW